jgi:hypothetical protein
VYCHQFNVQIFNLLAVSTKETAFAVYFELGPFRSKFTGRVKGTCDFFEYLFVSENRIGHEVVLIRLELALVPIVCHIP